MSPGFKDHFSGHAAEYAAHRPVYPEALYDWLADTAPSRELAWDCATGNGQAAVALARRFGQVFASDASEEQVRHAQPAVRVSYAVEPAEHSSLTDGSVDLVTVAQAFHWLDHSALFRECERVCRSGGVLAVWTYALARIDSQIDAVVEGFYDGTVGPYWPPERALVLSGYRDIRFPWPELDVPPFSMRADWTLAQFEDYLGTWSSVRRYMAAHGEDPVAVLHPDLQRVWERAGGGERTVRWPVSLRAFRLG